MLNTKSAVYPNSAPFSGRSETNVADPHVSTVQDFCMEDAMSEASRAPSSVLPVTPLGIRTVITNTLRQNDNNNHPVLQGKT